MVKFKVLKEFSYHDQIYKVDDVNELVDHVVYDLSARGYLKLVGDVEKIDMSDDMNDDESFPPTYSFKKSKPKRKKRKE